MLIDQLRRYSVAVVAGVGTVAILAALWLNWDAAVPTETPHTPKISQHRLGMIDDERIRNAARDEPGAWLVHGHGFEEQRFSDLAQINQDTVNELGIGWTKDLDTVHAVEATPLVVDGVMYFTSTWNVAFAVDARNGDEIWRYDPEAVSYTHLTLPTKA